MPECKKIKRPKRILCIGDLDSLIKLHTRAISAPAYGNVDFDEGFNDPPDTWAMVTTVKGKTFFDGAETETPITHEIGIRFDSTVTAETWITLNNERLDILNVEDLDGRQEWMWLQCTDRGDVAKDATKA
jgi:SPP1 family predicted phage head-tail adaptor